MPYAFVLASLPSYLLVAQPQSSSTSAMLSLSGMVPTWRKQDFFCECNVTNAALHCPVYGLCVNWIRTRTFALLEPYSTCGVRLQAARPSFEFPFSQPVSAGPRLPSFE